VWEIGRIAGVVGGRIHNPDPSRRVEGFSIDSRTLKPGQLFVALRGRRHDGHLFLEEAFRKGASGALVRTLPQGHKFPNCIEVPDPLSALQRLASAHRRKLDIPLIGITGSSGKTTTKELLYAILSRRFRAYRSPGNYNTEIGLPLALLEMPPQTEVGVFELALQRPGEIASLAEIAAPTLGVITSIGEAHLGFFADREALARAKWELIESLPPEGLAVLNYDSPYLAEWAEQLPFKAIGFGLRNERAQVRAAKIRDDSLKGLSFELCTPRGSFPVRTALLGRANVYNVLGAVAIALELGVEIEIIREALEGFKPLPHRMELKRSRRFGLVLDDAYNANPTSTKAALKTLARLRVPYKKVFVFGDMLELGDFAIELHREIAEVIDRLGIDQVFTMGELAGETAQALGERGWEPPRVLSAADLDELERLLERHLDDQNLILVKGSRAMGLDRLVEGLLAL